MPEKNMETIGQFKKNVQASFGYVKKDLLMINDAISDIHDKIQHLSMNHASLLQEIEDLKKSCNCKPKTSKKVIKKK